MTGPDTETLTAALRRLADEHASGLLSVATPGRDVVLELADGVPVGIGPPHDVSDRIGRDASAELVAAAVIDGLVDRTVAAIVGGGGAWVWDVADSATMMPVPPDLATELSRRAVDAAQAMAALAPDQVLLPARDLETHGEVDRVRDLFDGDRTLAEVAELAGLTVPSTATLAAALVAAGVLSTGLQDTGSRSWTDAVAGSSVEDDDEDEPELWVMDPPDDDEVEDDDGEDDTPAAPAASAAPAARATPEDVGEDLGEPIRWRTHEPDQPDQPDASTAPTEPAPTAPAPTEPAAEPATPAAAATDDEPATAGVGPTAADEASDDDWADTTWLNDLGGSDRPTEEARDGEEGDDEPSDARAALSAMITDLQGQESAPPAPPTPPAPAPTRQQRGQDAADGEEATEQRASPDAKRKEPKAAPGEVAEFLRELSRLALDDE